jgi:hypothetical protein
MQPLVYNSFYQASSESWENFSQEQWVIFDRLTDIIIFFQKQINWTDERKQIFVQCVEFKLTSFLFKSLFTYIYSNPICLNLEPLLIFDFQTNCLIFKQNQSLRVNNWNWQFEQTQETKLELDKVYFGRLVWFGCIPNLFPALSDLSITKVKRLIARKFIGFWPMKKLKPHLKTNYYMRNRDGIYEMQNYEEHVD